MRLPINIQVFVVRRMGDSYQYLMLHRHKTVPNFWQPVSGGVEEFEGIDETARREIVEETGIKEFTLRDPNYWRSYRVPERWIDVHGWHIWDVKHNVAKVYIAEVDSSAQVTLDDKEHDQLRWCSFDEAMGELFWPGDKKALLRVADYLQTPDCEKETRPPWSNYQMPIIAKPSIGQMARSERSWQLGRSKSMRLPVQVVIYIARKNGGSFEYLLLHRFPDRREFWQGVSGGVEQGETIEDAARRELLEEIGLVSELHNIGYSYSFPVEDMWASLYEWFTEHPEDLTIVVHNFVTITDSQFIPSLDGQEHDTFKWCTFEEALQTLYWDSDKESLFRVNAFLQERSGRPLD